RAGRSQLRQQIGKCVPLERLKTYPAARMACSRKSGDLTLIRQNILSSERSLTSLSPWRLCRNDENAVFVILNEVKNLMDSIRYTTQILRLPPQNEHYDTVSCGRELE